ncbi:MAG: tetratricopeptide repeat protein, partial [Bryocella sp.]
MTFGFRASSARPLVRRACYALAFVSTTCVVGQAATTSGTATSETKPASAVATAPTPNRSMAYYHYGLAKIYENQASQNGRQDLATQAIEQYKMALDADPNSRVLQDGLSNLYFKLGRIREAVAAAQDQVGKHPDDVDAHLLLGRVYLRSLGDGTGPQTND